jgi:hypothetical protein
MTNRKFYKTTFKLVVLSEDPIEDRNFDRVMEECDSGDLVLGSLDASGEMMNGEEAAEALYSAGSEPGFFRLTDDGEDSEY